MIKKLAKCQAVFMLLLFFVFPAAALADAGPKPSITVYVKNMATQTYYLDLLVKGDDNLYNKFNDRYPESYKELPIYKYREGEWMAKQIRERTLFGSLNGSYREDIDMMVHKFTYFGVPKTFKIIIQYENGEIYKTDEITPNMFFANVVLDLKTGEIHVVKGSYVGYISNKINLLRTVLIYMLVTILAELITAIPFKIKYPKVIVLANLFTQIILHSVLITLFYSRYYSIIYDAFLLSELLILFIEYFIYKRFTTGISWKKLLAYTFTANFITYTIGLFIQI